MCAAYPDELPTLAELLRAIEVPVQVIAGARDPMVPPRQRLPPRRQPAPLPGRPDRHGPLRLRQRRDLPRQALPARDLAAAVMRWEQVPELPLFTGNTAAFVHEMESSSISDVNGLGDHVRVQVLTPVGVLGRDKQLGVVAELTEIVAGSAADPTLPACTWVLLTDAREGAGV